MVVGFPVVVVLVLVGIEELVRVLFRQFAGYLLCAICAFELRRVDNLYTQGLEYVFSFLRGVLGRQSDTFIPSFLLMAA